MPPESGARLELLIAPQNSYIFHSYLRPPNKGQTPVSFIFFQTTPFRSVS